jgi:hypothetical protein
LLAVNPLAKAEYDEIATTIYKTLGEINSEALFGLHNRSLGIQDIAKSSERRIVELQLDSERTRLDLKSSQAEIQKLASQNEELKTQLLEQDKTFEESRRQEDDSKFHALEDLLGVRNPFPTTYSFAPPLIEASRSTTLMRVPTSLIQSTL